METHSVTRSSNNTSISPSMLRSFPSQAQGIAMVTVFMFESGLIVGGNMLAIILFAKEKKLRRKSLFLVMNMALADVMLGAVSLPLYVYLFIGPYHLLWTAKANTSMVYFYHFLDATFSQSSLISAGFISCERFYAIYWPLKHQTMSMRAYSIVIFMVWSLAILTGSIVFFLSYHQKSFKTAALSWMSFPLSFLFIVCACNISIWRKVRKRNIALLQQNRAASQNQRLTKTLLFVSAISVLSWLPLVVVNYLTVVQEVGGVVTDLIVGIITIINLSNSILNPFVFVLRIPEFRQALSLCFSRRQAEVNRPRMEGRENMAAVFTPVQHEITTLQPDSSQVQQTFEQETIDTKLWSNFMIKLLIFYNNNNSIAIITQLKNWFSQSLGLIIPRSQSVSGNGFQAAKIELAERDRENAVRGLGKNGKH